MKEKFLRDSFFGIGSTVASDYESSKKYLLSLVMKKYKILDSDLHDFNLVKSKIRETNINDIVDA